MRAREGRWTYGHIKSIKREREPIPWENRLIPRGKISRRKLSNEFFPYTKASLLHEAFSRNSSGGIFSRFSYSNVCIVSHQKPLLQWPSCRRMSSARIPTITCPPPPPAGPWLWGRALFQSSQACSGAQAYLFLQKNVLSTQSLEELC